MDDQQKVLNTYNQYLQALIENDTEKLSSLIAEEAKLYHITGRLQTKQEWLSSIKNGEMRYHSVEEVSNFVSINEEGADLVVKNNLTATIDGMTNTWPLESDMKLVLKGDVWKIIQAKTRLF